MNLHNCCSVKENRSLTRRSFLAAAPLAAARAAKAKRPNFIIFLADDLGGKDLGCYGARDLKTPNLDALAASGARFTNFYSNAPVCSASRAGLMTGRYPLRNGIQGLVGGRGEDPGLNPREKTVATLLRDAGYTTALTGKWHLGASPVSVPNSHGFDYFYGFHGGMQDYFTHTFRGQHDLFRNREPIGEDGRYLTNRIAEEAADFIGRAGERPFLLYVAFNAPHVPLQAPEDYLNRFPNLQNKRKLYAAMISAMDDAVGTIMRTVERRGIQDNTCSVFFSDNGGQLPEGDNAPYRGYKLSLFDGGMHSPAIMNWPGTIRPGRVVDEVVMAMDFMPTFCKAAGVPVPADRTIDGRDILPVVVKSAKSPHDAIFWYYHDRRFPMPAQVAVRRGKWKLVVNGILFDHQLGGTNNPTLTGDDAMFLSDLGQDPGETVNLRRKYPQVADELNKLLLRWQEEVKTN